MRLAPDLHGRKSLWSTGLMRVLRIDDMIESDRAVFTQPLALCRLGRYLIEMHRVRCAVVRCGAVWRGVDMGFCYVVPS